MRYAVPITDGKLREHFGHCSHFAFFDVDETRKTIIKREIVASPGHQPGLLPAWLAEERSHRRYSRWNGIQDARCF